MVSLEVQGSNPDRYVASVMRMSGHSVRAIARRLGKPVPEIHRMFGCRDGNNCIGRGCHVPKSRSSHR